MKQSKIQIFKKGLLLAVLIAGVAVACGKKGPLYFQHSVAQPQQKVAGESNANEVKKEDSENKASTKKTTLDTTNEVEIVK